jgi:hypothetical protein
LVENEPKGRAQAFLERTPKPNAFQQFEGFVRPGGVRLDVSGLPKWPLVGAFRIENGREVVVVVINRGKAALKFDIRVTGAVNFSQRMITTLPLASFASMTGCASRMSSKRNTRAGFAL